MKNQLVRKIQWKFEDSFVEEEFDFPLQAFIDEEVLDSWIVVIDRELDYEVARYNVDSISGIFFHTPKKTITENLLGEDLENDNII